jgi:YHS domain-containing protein
MFRLREKQFAALATMLIGGLVCSKWSLAAAQNSLLWQTNLETAKQVAAQTNRLILVHFWSPTCAACKQLDKNVYTISQVQQAIQSRFVPVKINADDWPTTTKQYGITVLPTDLIITPSGQIVGRMVCPAAPEAYMQQLAIAASGAAPVAGPSVPSYGATVPPGTAAGVAAVAMPPAGGWMPASPAAPATSAMSATPPIATSTSAPNVGWGAAPSSNSSSVAPAVTAYTDSRYAEYFQRYSAASTGTAAGVSAAPNATTAAAPTASSPAAYAATSYAPSAYTPPAYATAVSPAATPYYAAPTANTSQPAYGSPAISPGSAVAPPAYAAPAYRSPANTSSPYAPPTSSAAPASPSTAAAMSAPIVSQRYSSQTAQAQLAATAGTTVATTAAGPPLALDGYCPVTLAEQQRWQLGDRRWGAIHRGRTYLFAGPEQQRKFLANPDRYSPAISGQDVVMALDYGQEVEGKRAMGVEYQNRIYLFSSDASRQAFSQNPKRYAAEVLQAETPPQTTLR